jgi:hypothetical protein
MKKILLVLALTLLLASSCFAFKNAGTPISVDFDTEWPKCANVIEITDETPVKGGYYTFNWDEDSSLPRHGEDDGRYYAAIDKDDSKWNCLNIMYKNKTYFKIIDYDSANDDYALVAENGFDVVTLLYDKDIEYAWNIVKHSKNPNKFGPPSIQMVVGSTGVNWQYVQIAEVQIFKDEFHQYIAGLPILVDKIEKEFKVRHPTGFGHVDLSQDQATIDFIYTFPTLYQSDQYGYLDRIKEGDGYSLVSIGENITTGSGGLIANGKLVESLKFNCMEALFPVHFNRQFISLGGLGAPNCTLYLINHDTGEAVMHAPIEEHICGFDTKNEKNETVFNVTGRGSIACPSRWLFTAENMATWREYAKKKNIKNFRFRMELQTTSVLGTGEKGEGGWDKVVYLTEPFVASEETPIQKAAYKGNKVALEQIIGQTPATEIEGVRTPKLRKFTLGKGTTVTSVVVRRWVPNANGTLDAAKQAGEDYSNKVGISESKIDAQGRTVVEIQFPKSYNWVYDLTIKYTDQTGTEKTINWPLNNKKALIEVGGGLYEYNPVFK